MLGEILHPGTKILAMMATQWEFEAVSFLSDKACLHENAGFGGNGSSCTNMKLVHLV